MRADDHLFMNGMEIFKFSATDVVKTLSGFIQAEGLAAADIDSLFLHQANHFINDKIAKKLQLGSEKVPYTIGFYGNTGSASIPLTMTHHFSTANAKGAHRAVLCGFGVGLSVPPDLIRVWPSRPHPQSPGTHGRTRFRTRARTRARSCRGGWERRSCCGR